MGFSFGLTDKQKKMNKLSVKLGRKATKDDLKNYDKIMKSSGEDYVPLAKKEPTKSKKAPKVKIGSSRFAKQIVDDGSVAPELSIANYNKKNNPKPKTTKVIKKIDSIPKKELKRKVKTRIEKRNANIASDIKAGSLPKNSKKIEAPKSNPLPRKAPKFIGPKKKPVDWQAINPAKGSSGVFARDGYVDENVTAGVNSVDATNSPDYVAPTKPVVKKPKPKLDSSFLSPALKSVYDGLPNSGAKKAFLDSMKAQDDRIKNSAMNAPSLPSTVHGPSTQAPIVDSVAPHVGGDPRLKRTGIGQDTLGSFMNPTPPPAITPEYVAEVAAKGGSIMADGSVVYPDAPISEANQQAANEFDKRFIANREAGIAKAQNISAFVDPQIAEFDAPFKFDPVTQAPAVVRKPSVAPVATQPHVVATNATSKAVADVVAKKAAVAKEPVSIQKSRFATVDPLNLFGNSNGANVFDFGISAPNGNRFSGGKAKY